MELLVGVVQELLGSGAHLFGSLGGEREGKHLLGSHVLGAQPRDAPGYDASFAGARAGDHQERAAWMRDRLELSIVEVGKQPGRHCGDGSFAWGRQWERLHWHHDPMSPKGADARALDVDWLALCRRATSSLKSVFSRHPSTAERALGTGRGVGGDETLLIDGGAEDAIFAELDALHADGYDFTAISEERGEVIYGDAAGGVRVVIDPIDGSLNAKRLIPTYSLSIAVASGETMEDVQFGYVYDFGTDEEYVARLGEGATLGGETLDSEELSRGLELVGFEAARPGWIAPVAADLEGAVYRIRVVGSIAVTLCYVAAARLDGMLTANTCRSVDAAAGQLIAREAGAFVSILGHGGIEAPLDMDARFRMAAARTPEGLETLVGALTSTGVPPAD